MRKKCFVFPKTIALIRCLVLIFFVVSLSSLQAKSRPIKVGHIVDLSGHEAMVGQGFQAALEFAFEQINYEINGQKVDLIVGDAQGQPNTAVDVARKMVERDKVAAIIGPTQAGQKMAVAGYMNQAGVPLILYNPMPMGFFMSGKNKWVIGGGGSEMQNPTAMADYIFNDLGYRSINTMTLDNFGGRAFLKPLTDLFTKMGGKVVQQQWTPAPCPDFAPYLTTLKPADALVAWNPGSDAIKFFSQYKQLGINMPLANHFAGGYLDVFVAYALGDDADAMMGVPGPMMYSPDSVDPVNQAFVEAYKTKFARPPADSGNTASYQGALLFIELVKAAGGKTNPKSLMRALSKVKVEGPEGVVYFEKNSLVATRTVYICAEEMKPWGPGYKTLATYKHIPPTGYVP